MNFYIMMFRIELSLIQMLNKNQHNVGLNFFFTNCINNLPDSWMLCSLLGVVHVRTCHRNFSHILKGLIHLILKEEDPNLSLICHLEVDFEYALEVSLLALKWLYSCTIWSWIMNGQWLTLLKKWQWSQFLPFRKDFNWESIRKTNQKFSKDTWFKTFPKGS